MLFELAKVNLADTCISVEFARKELSFFISGLPDDLSVVVLSIEQNVVLLNHLDYQLVVAANVCDIIRFCMLRTEHIWTHGDCHVVCGHFVQRLVLNNHFEHIDVELKRVIVDLWKFIDPVFEFQECKYELYVGVFKIRTVLLDISLPEELLVKLVRNERVFHSTQYSLPVICDCVRIWLGFQKCKVAL